MVFIFIPLLIPLAAAGSVAAYKGVKKHRKERKNRKLQARQGVAAEDTDASRGIVVREDWDEELPAYKRTASVRLPAYQVV